MTSEKKGTVTLGSVTATYVSTGELSEEQYDQRRKNVIKMIARMAARRDHMRYLEGQTKHRKQVLTPAGGVCKWRRNQR